MTCMAKVKPDNWSWSLPENRRYTMMTYKDSLGRPSHFGLRVMKNEQGHPLPLKEKKQVLNVASTKLSAKVLEQLAIQCHCQLERGIQPENIKPWKDAMLAKLTSL